MKNITKPTYASTCFLNQIRWITVVLVVLYHICYLYNGAGVLGALPGARTLPAGDILCLLIYPWFMVLLYVVSGVCAYFALEKTHARAWLKSRAVKLLLPSTAGLFIYQWITGYINIRLGGGLAYIPGWLVYPISVLSGSGPLWFVQLLFVYCALLVLLRKFSFFNALRERAVLPAWGLGLLALVIWGASYVLNAPVITVYRFGIYAAAFFIGYLVFSHEENRVRLEQTRWIWLAAAALSGVAVAFSGTVNWAADSFLTSPLCNLYCWMSVLAILGCARATLNRESAFDTFMNRHSYALYVLHYPAATVVCAGLLKFFALPAIVNYALGFVLTLCLTAVVYEIFRRVPVLRLFVLGEK